MARSAHAIRSPRAVLLAVGLVSLGFTLSIIGCHRTPSPEVLATVNGKEILASELDRIYKQNLDDNGQPPSKEEAAIHRLQILHGLIEDEILQQRAATLNLVATDEEVDAKLTDMKALSTQEEFDQQLKEKNLTLEDARREIRREITRTKLINKEIESKVNITDAEIGNYYNAHKSEFDLIEPRYHLARIVVTNEASKQVNNLENNKAGNDSEAKKKIQSLRNRLDTGEDFGSVAARFSEDPSSSSNGGDSGFVYETQLRTDLPDVFAAVSKLKAGQTTEVLPITQQIGANRKTVGYAIYQLIGKSPAGKGELSDPRVQQTIRQMLHNTHAQLLREAYFEMLDNDAKVHNYLAEQIYKNGAS